VIELECQSTAGDGYDQRDTTRENKITIIKGHILKTKISVAVAISGAGSLFHGAAATKSGAARAIIEVAKRIMLFGG
jgi:hypothetical protein